MFGRSRGFRGFRPRNSTHQALHVATLTLVGVVSGYYIFNEPLKKAVAEVKAKEAGERAAAGGGVEVAAVLTPTVVMAAAASAAKVPT